MLIQQWSNWAFTGINAPRLYAHKMERSWWTGCATYVGHELLEYRTNPHTNGPSSGIFYFFGGLLQILGGFMDWIVGNTFSSVVFLSYGMFPIRSKLKRSPKLTRCLRQAPSGLLSLLRCIPRTTPWARTLSLTQVLQLRRREQRNFTTPMVRNSVSPIMKMKIVLLTNSVQPSSL